MSSSEFPMDEFDAVDVVMLASRLYVGKMANWVEASEADARLAARASLKEAGVFFGVVAGEQRVELDGECPDAQPCPSDPSAALMAEFCQGLQVRPKDAPECVLTVVGAVHRHCQVLLQLSDGARMFYYFPDDVEVVPC